MRERFVRAKGDLPLRRTNAIRFSEAVVRSRARAGLASPLVSIVFLAFDSPPMPIHGSLPALLIGNSTEPSGRRSAHIFNRKVHSLCRQVRSPADADRGAPTTGRLRIAGSYTTPQAKGKGLFREQIPNGHGLAGERYGLNRPYQYYYRGWSKKRGEEVGLVDRLVVATSAALRAMPQMLKRDRPKAGSACFWGENQRCSRRRGYSVSDARFYSRWISACRMRIFIGASSFPG